MKESEIDARTTVLLIEEDDDTRLLFKELLKNRGYKVKLTINEADALEKAGNGIGKVDVILVDLVRTPTEEILKAGQRVREIGQLNVPVVAIAEEYKDELQGTSVRFGENEYVVYLEDSEELFDLLSKLTKSKAPA
jgi:CheY-like chemotaxis protein